jgi:hypothetical protein
MGGHILTERAHSRRIRGGWVSPHRVEPIRESGFHLTPKRIHGGHYFGKFVERIGVTVAPGKVRIALVGKHRAGGSGIGASDILAHERASYAHRFELWKRVGL